MHRKSGLDTRDVQRRSGLDTRDVQRRSGLDTRDMHRKSGYVYSGDVEMVWLCLLWGC